MNPTSKIEGPKQCSECKEIKPQSEYTKTKDRCKACVRAYVKKWYRINKERILSKQHIYRQTPKGKAVAKKTTQNMMRKYPNKYMSRSVFRNALACRKIKKQPCVICKSEKSEGHHPDYSKPLEVVWLCMTHHKEIHYGKLG